MTSFFGPAAYAGYVLPEIPVLGLEPGLVALSAAVLAMGLSDIVSGLAERLAEDDDRDADSTGADDPTDEFGGGQFGEEAFDDFGDEEFEDWEEDGGPDGLEGAGGGTSDFEPRIDEIEEEVANISSTVSTVRSENQAINESVEEMEDNIRQLLDIYEMVTRGVNPFVDDVAGGGADGSFGLFDGGNDEEFDDLDPEVADANPDSFFDDDFGDDEAEEGATDPFEEDSAGLVDDGVEPETADDTPDETSAEPGETAEEGGDDGGSGKTFEQLKSEYESSDVDEDPSDDGADGSAQESVGEHGSDSDTLDGPPSDDGGSPEEDDRGAATDEGSSSESAASTDGGAAQRGGDDDSAGKPYLEELPDGYATELLVIEWLSFLRSRSNTSEALRAIRYYETIDWIGGPAASALKEYLTGLADGTPDASAGDGTQLTIDHHTHSLRYIGRLGSADVEIERLDWPSPTRGEARIERGEQRGIQR